MKPPFFLFLLLPLFFFLIDEAKAAPQSAVLMLGDFSQKVDLEYRYSGQETTTDGATSSHSQQYFREEYNLQVPYAFFNPRIWRGTVGFGVRLEQDSNSSSPGPSNSSTGTGFKYNITGSVLERSFFPLNFFSRTEQIRAQREFTNSYNIDFDTKGLNFTIKNKYLPAKVNYTHSTTETSGLTENWLHTTDNLVLEVTHKVQQLSETTGQITYFTTSAESKQTGELNKSRTYEASLYNLLHLSRLMPDRTLSSRVQMREDTAIEVDKLFSVYEQLSWPLGKALTSNANYSFTKRDSPRGTDTYQVGHVALQHRLLANLTTELAGDIYKDDLVTGTEKKTAGSLHLLYQKKLPLESDLQLNAGLIYLVTDRDLNDSIIFVPSEIHAAGIPAANSTFFLNNLNIDLNTIQVYDITHTIPYTLGTHYTAQSVFGNRTEITILPGVIADGQSLLISYSYLTNTQIKYSTNTRRLDFNLRLFNSAYRLYGSWLDMQQDLISGQADYVSLYNQTSYKLGLEMNRLYWTGGAEYENVDSDIDNHQTLLGFTRYTRLFGVNAISLYASDGYTKTRPNSFTGPTLPERSTNTFTAGGTWNRQLFSTAQMMFTAKYFNLSGDAVARDDISLGLNMRWNYGKIAMSLTSQVNWRMQADFTTRDELVQFHVTRYF